MSRSNHWMWQPRSMNGRFASSGGGWGEGPCDPKDWKKNALIGAAVGLAVFLPVLWFDEWWGVLGLLSIIGWVLILFGK